MDQPGVLVAIDYGRVRLGLAVCDRLGIATRPLGHIRREDDAQAARMVAAVAAQEAAEALVIGMPFNADGSQGGNVRWVRTFCRALQAVCDLPMKEVDERYSSDEAEEALRQEGRWPTDPGRVDAKAAAIILRRYLDQR